MSFAVNGHDQEINIYSFIEVKITPTYLLWVFFKGEAGRGI